MKVAKLYVRGAYVALCLSILNILIGVFVISPSTIAQIPTKLGLWRLVASLSPEFVGLTPAFHYGIPWRYTWEEFYATSNLHQQHAVVTGANSGMGYDIVAALVRVGASVTMVCRNASKCETAAEKIRSKIKDAANIDTMIMDTASLLSIKKFADAYMERHKAQPIDMLFLNAGVSKYQHEQDDPCYELTEDGIELLFQTNYLGHHLMFRLLEPLLAKSKLARVVQTSSASSFTTFSHKVATDMQTLLSCSEPIYADIFDNKFYGQSKLAQILWVKALTKRRLDKTNTQGNIYANAFNPGMVNTGIIDKVFDHPSNPQWLKDGIRWLVQEISWQPPDGALTGLFLAAVPPERLTRENIRGKYFHPIAQEVIHPLSLDETLNDNLWEFSNQLVRKFLPPADTSPSSVPIES